MPRLEELRIAVNATEEWIDDLLRRLGWTDRERVYLVLLASLHALRDAVARDEAVSTSGRNCRPCCAAFIMKAGIRAHAQLPVAAPRFWNACMTAYTATRESMQKRSHEPCSPCSPRGCLQQRSRPQGPPRQSSYTTCGQAEVMLSL